MIEKNIEVYVFIYFFLYHNDILISQYPWMSEKKKHDLKLLTLVKNARLIK